MTEIIRTENLTKYFGKVRAVFDLSITVRKGEIYGFLGLNGAGKTTTIRMLLGMVYPTAGRCFIDNRKVNPGNDRIWEKVGYIVEIPYSYPDLTVRENLEIIRRLRLIPDKNTVDRVIDKLRISQYADRKARYLSQGNAQRLGIARAILHDPEILILDEPSNGLDLAGIVEIRELLHDLAHNKGVTIFISSHILGEISKFATRIGIIHKGRLIQEVDSTQLGQLSQRRLLLNTRDNNSVFIVLTQNNFKVKINEEGILEIYNEEIINHPENIAALLVKAGLPPTLLKVEEEDLESYFLRTIGTEGGAE